MWHLPLSGLAGCHKVDSYRQSGGHWRPHCHSPITPTCCTTYWCLPLQQISVDLPHHHLTPLGQCKVVQNYYQQCLHWRVQHQGTLHPCRVPYGTISNQSLICYPHYNTTTLLGSPTIFLHSWLCILPLSGI
jgi:hypothetical protein